MIVSWNQRISGRDGVGISLIVATIIEKVLTQRHF